MSTGPLAVATVEAPRVRPGSVPECPFCHAPLDVESMVRGLQSCPACARDFEATPFSPPDPFRPPLAMAEVGPGGATPCAVHPGNAAVGNCGRCGLFVCALCRTPVFELDLCPACFDRLAAEKGNSPLRTSFTDFKAVALLFALFGWIFSVIGVLVGPLTIGLALLAIRQRRRGEWSGGWFGVLLALGLGIGQLAAGIFILGSFWAGMKR